MDPTCPIVKNMLLLDSEGKRIAVKYYTSDWPTVAGQGNFEKTLWNKTSRTAARAEAEIVLFDGHVVVYKYLGDLMFYVTGSQDENELVLTTVLTAFYEAVSILLSTLSSSSPEDYRCPGQQVEKKTVLENLDLVLLAIDEIIDGGIILETDAAMIAGRVTMRGAEGEVPLSEQTFSKALASAKETLARSLLR